MKGNPMSRFFLLEPYDQILYRLLLNGDWWCSVNGDDWVLFGDSKPAKSIATVTYTRAATMLEPGKLLHGERPIVVDTSTLETLGYTGGCDVLQVRSSG